MVIARKDDKRWMVASYDVDGNPLGWATSRDSTMCWTINCAIVDKSAAERLCARMERIWPGRIWVVEPAPRTHIDARTGAPLSADVVRKRGMDAAVAEGFVREQERDEHFGRQHSTERNKPTLALDTAPRHALASDVHGTRPTADNDEEGVSGMVLVKDGKKAAGKKSTAKVTKAGGKAKAVAKVPKMQLRTAAAESNGGGPCLCGCGAIARNYLLRGHVKRVDSQLAAIKAGTAKPENEFGKKIAKAMGPWKENRGGGFVPAVTSFEKIRANL